MKKGVASRRRMSSSDLYDRPSNLNASRLELARQRSQLREGYSGQSPQGPKLSDTALSRSVEGLMAKANSLVEGQGRGESQTRLDPSFDSILDISGTGMNQNNNSNQDEEKTNHGAKTPKGEGAHEYYPELSVLSDILKNMNTPAPLNPSAGIMEAGVATATPNRGSHTRVRRKNGRHGKTEKTGEASVASKAEFLQLVVLLRKLMSELDHQKRMAQSLKEEGERSRRELADVTARATQLSEATEQASRAETSLALMERRFATLLKWAREEEQRRKNGEEEVNKLQDEISILSGKLDKAEAIIQIKKADEHKLSQALQTIKTLEETLGLLKPRLAQREVEVQELQGQKAMLNQENLRYSEENDRLSERVVELETNHRVREERLRECERGKELLEREMAHMQQRCHGIETKLADERKSRQDAEDALSIGKIGSQGYHATVQRQHQYQHQQQLPPPPGPTPAAAPPLAQRPLSSFVSYPMGPSTGYPQNAPPQLNRRNNQSYFTSQPVAPPQSQPHLYNSGDYPRMANPLASSADSGLGYSRLMDNRGAEVTRSYDGYSHHIPSNYSSGGGYSSPKAHERTRPRSIVSFPVTPTKL